MPSESFQRFEEERRAALGARDAGRHEDALRHLRAAREALPTDRWTRADIAGELASLDRLDEAEAEALALAADAPDFAPVHRRLALLARVRGDRERALDAFREAARLDPRDLWSRHDEAIELRALKRDREAEAVFAAVATATPAAHALRGLGSLARTEGRHEEALEHFRAACLLRPDDPWFALDIVLAFRALSRFDEAAQACAALLRKHPTFAPALCEEADLLGKAGRIVEARTVLARLLVAQPNHLDAYRGLARLATEAGDHEGALAHLRAAAKRHPGDVSIRLDLADCLRRTEGAVAARAAIEAARALDPAHPRANLLLADDRRERGDLDGADAVYDDILRQRPDFYWALVGKAVTARLRGDAAAAARFFTRAMTVDPTEGHAQVELAATLRDAGDPAGARNALACLSPASPRAGQAAMVEGLIHRATGDWPGAADAFLDAADRFPHLAEARIEAAEDLMRAGRAGDAEEVLDAARQATPDHPALLEAEARRALIRDDLDAAEACLDRARRKDFARLWPPLGLARIRAMRGELGQALRDLDACETRFGERPDIELVRIDLLRQGGETASMAARLAAARVRFAHYPMLHQAAILADIDAGRFDEARSALLGTRANAGPAAGRALFLCSLLEAARWDFPAAIEAGEGAVAALPGDGWVRNRLIHAALLGLDLDRAKRHLAELARLEAGASALRGKSANPSQSHYGQIFDEFRMDGEILDAVRDALGQGPAECDRRLSAILRDNGDSTLAAIQFFIHRRRSGLLAPSGDAGRASPIPRVIHQYWDEPDLPPDLSRYVATWKERNPGFEHRLWNEKSARSFLASRPAPVLAAFDRAEEPAMKADLLRLALLHEFGGLYADADDRCVEGVAPLLAGGESLVVYQEDLGSLGNNFIAAAPRHPVVARALDLGVRAVNRGDTDILWLATGPGLLTRAAAQVLAENPTEAADLRVLDRPQFLRHVAIHCLAAYKATHRHWSRTAFGRARVQATRARSA